MFITISPDDTLTEVICGSLFQLLAQACRYADIMVTESSASVSVSSTGVEGIPEQVFEESGWDTDGVEESLTIGVVTVNQEEAQLTRLTFNVADDLSVYIDVYNGMDDVHHITVSVSCFMPKVSCFMPKLFCFMPKLFCFMPKMFCFMPKVSCFTPKVSCFRLCHALSVSS